MIDYPPLSHLCSGKHFCTPQLESTSAAKPTSLTQSLSHSPTQQCSQNDGGKCTIHKNESSLQLATLRMVNQQKRVEQETAY